MSYGKHKLKRRPRKSRKSHSKRTTRRVRRGSAIKKRSKRPVKRTVKKLWKRGGLKRKVDKEVRKVIDKDEDKGILINVTTVSVGAGVLIQTNTGTVTPSRAPGTYGLSYCRSRVVPAPCEGFVGYGSGVTWPITSELGYGSGVTSWQYGNMDGQVVNNNIPNMFGSYKQVIDAASSLFNGKGFSPWNYFTDTTTTVGHNLGVNDNIHVIGHSLEFCLNWNSNIQGTIEMFIFTAKTNLAYQDVTQNGGLQNQDPVSVWQNALQEENRTNIAMQYGTKDWNGVHNLHCGVSPALYKLYHVKKLSWSAHPGACYKHIVHDMKDKTFKGMNYFANRSDYYDITKGTKFVLFRCKAEPTISTAVSSDGSTTSYVTSYQTNGPAVSSPTPGDALSVGGMVGTIKEVYRIAAPASCNTSSKLNNIIRYDQTASFERGGTNRSGNGIASIIINPSGFNSALNLNGTNSTSIF